MKDSALPGIGIGLTVRPSPLCLRVKSPLDEVPVSRFQDHPHTQEIICAQMVVCWNAVAAC